MRRKGGFNYPFKMYRIDITDVCVLGMALRKVHRNTSHKKVEKGFFKQDSRTQPGRDGHHHRNKCQQKTPPKYNSPRLCVLTADREDRGSVLLLRVESASDRLENVRNSPLPRCNNQHSRTPLTNTHARIRIAAKTIQLHCL